MVMKIFFLVFFIGATGAMGVTNLSEQGFSSMSADSRSQEQGHDQQFGPHGFTSTGDNPFVPKPVDVSPYLVRSHLQDVDIKKKTDDMADEVIDRLKKGRLLEASKKGMAGEDVPKSSPRRAPVQQGMNASSSSDLSSTSLLEQDLNMVFEDPALNAKKISLNTPPMGIKKALETIAKLSGISFLIDQDVTGNVGALQIKNKTPGELLRLITDSHKPKLAVIKKGADVWRIMLYSEAQQILREENAGKLVHKALPIKHARVTDKFVKKVKNAWRSVSGDDGSKKDPNKYLYIDDEEKKVLVRGHPVEVQELYKFLFEIDKPIIQIRIDVILVLAQKSFDFAFGIDWSGIYNRQQTMESRSGTGFWGFGATSTDYPTPTSSTVDNNSNLLVNPDNFSVNLFSSLNSLLSDKADIRRIADFIKIPFVFGGPDLNLRRLNLVLNAAETHSKLKIISRPSVLTSNNETAKLLIGQSIPLQTAIEDVTTANTRNITTINFKDTGIVLEVKPTASSDGKSVTLDVFLEDSQVTSGDTRANDQGIMTNPPTISVIKAKNNVILKSGQTTIIGGLSGNRNNSASNDIPYLSKLPIIGKVLFKSDFDYNETTERFIFVTPTIIEQEVE